VAPPAPPDPIVTAYVPGSILTELETTIPPAPPPPPIYLPPAPPPPATTRTSHLTGNIVVNVPDDKNVCTPYFSLL
jgi:hypothetical protein